VLARNDVTFRWVKGHSGDRMNDLVDLLAVEAAQTQRGRTGTNA
jgi:ribonuclease HI